MAIRDVNLPTIERPPLPYEELRDVIDLALWAGQLLLHFGAESQRIEETVHHLGTGLGCNWLDIVVSPNAIMITTSSGIEFRTKIRRVVNMGVNLAVVDQVNALSRRVFDGELDRFGVRQELERISHMPPQYNRWLVIVAVGLSCAAFSRLFGADWSAFGAVWLAASVAMFVRQELHHRFFNPFLITSITAFIAGTLASLVAARWGVSDTPQLALAACVLLLVPGVPLITAAEDLFEGHMVTGIVRGVFGGIVSLAIALGLLIAIRLTGVQPL